MTAGLPDQPPPARNSPASVVIVVIVVGAAIAFVALIGVGITFAFVLGTPIVERAAEFFGGSSTSDGAAIAVRIAGLWWAFAAFAGASFCAAAIVLVALIRALNRIDRG